MAAIVLLNSFLGATALAETANVDAVQAVKNISSNNDDGIYFGGQLGFGRLSGDSGFEAANNTQVDIYKSNKNTNYSFKNKQGGLAGRIYAGYQFNPYMALEAGYSDLGNNSYTSSADGIHSIPTLQGSGLVLNPKQQFGISAKTIDIAAKGILPLSFVSDSLSNASLFAKAGVAYEMYNISGNLSADNLKPHTVNYNFVGKHHKFLPEFGGGLEYRFDNGLGLDLSYTRVQGKGSISYNKTTNDLSISKNFAPSSNLIMGGISYRFNL